MITPVSDPASPSTDTSAPVTTSINVDTPMTTTEAPAAPGSISSLESSIQSAADAALADAQTQGPGTTSGAIESTGTISMSSTQNSFSQYQNSLSGTETAWMGVGAFIYFAIILISLVSQYVLSRKLKLDYPWLGLIPVVNVYNLIKIAGHDGWKVILAIIPIVNFFYIAFSLNPAISRRTGHGVWTSVGLFFLFPIVFPYIAFTYKGADEIAAPVSPTAPATPATF
jgi:Family of unknown function (DUF5684)